MTFNPSTDPFRLRIGVDNVGGGASGEFELYAKKNSGSYAAITTSSTGGVRSYDASSDADNTAIRIPRLYPFSAWQLSGAAVDLDFANNRIYPSGVFTDYLSCSRASIGYAKNADGTLSQFSSNTLRIGTGIGLSAAEDARTNLFAYSQDSSQWNPINTTVVATTDTAPDGTATAARVRNDASGGYIFGYSAALTNDTYAFSLYVKIVSGSQTWFLLRQNQLVVSAYTSVWFNLTGAGSVGSSSSNGAATFVSASIESLANGWYRIGLVTTLSDAVDHSNHLQIRGGLAADGDQYSLTVDDTYDIWGMQCEQASLVSSYIPTTTTSAARAADVITTTSTLQTAIAAATGSIVAQVNNGKIANVAANVVDSNGTNLLGFDATNHGLASMTATLATTNTANRTALDKLGIAWDASGRSLAVNGGTVATDGSAQTPSSTQHLGSSGTVNFTFADLERLTVWTSKIADATLQGDTT